MFILSDRGYVPISTVSNTGVNIWCGGQEFQPIKVDDLGFCSDCYHISFDNGMYITCGGTQTLQCGSAIAEVRCLKIGDKVQLPVYPSLKHPNDCSHEYDFAEVPLTASRTQQNEWLVRLFSNENMTHQNTRQDVVVSSYRLKFVRELQMMLATHWGMDTVVTIDDSRPCTLSIPNEDLYKFYDKSGLKRKGEIRKVHVKGIIKLGFDLKLYKITSPYVNLGINGILV